MALEKETKTNRGITASYHKIDMVSIDTNSQTLSCVVRLYADKEHASMLDTHIDETVVFLAENDYIYIMNKINKEPVLTALYCYVKTLEQFKDSKNI